jgi:hypothetical protein
MFLKNRILEEPVIKNPTYTHSCSPKLFSLFVSKLILPLRLKFSFFRQNIASLYIRIAGSIAMPLAVRSSMKCKKPIGPMFTWTMGSFKYRKKMR